MIESSNSFLKDGTGNRDIACIFRVPKKTFQDFLFFLFSIRDTERVDEFSMGPRGHFNNKKSPVFSTICFFFFPESDTKCWGHGP